MTSKQEKRRRAALVQGMVEEDTKKAIEAMPLSLQNLGELFDYLDEELSEHDCDHTCRMTMNFLSSKKLDAESILPWLGEYGGNCDCEVLANVEESWEDQID